MLRELRIRNIAVVESVDVEFGQGLNVISGETGAGKSVLLGALALVLGGRASPDQVRHGAASASVEANFEVNPRSPALAVLEREGLLTEDGRLQLRRLLTAQGGGKAFIGDRAVPVATLREIGRTLVDLGDQQEQQRLADPETVRGLLDRFGGLEEQAERLRELHGRLGALRREAEAVTREARDADQRRDWLRFQLDELTALGLREGESPELELERGRLRHAEELREGSRNAERELYADEGSAVERMARAAHLLRQLSTLDPGLASLADTVQEALWRVEDAARALQGAARRFPDDPGRLDTIESRLDEISRLTRKHRCDADGLIARQRAIAAELEGLENLDLRRQRIENATRALREEAARAAAALRSAREEAARRLEEGTRLHLGGLAMPKAGFRVVLKPISGGEPLGEGLELGPSGSEVAELWLGANAGEELRPLGRVASGGELSRVLLALKLAQADRIGRTLIFDEIDAGMGGDAAEKVGRKLRELARHTQVLSVTHQPRLAGLADHHFAVTKRVEAGRTRSVIRGLGAQERVEEVARMIGGHRPSPTSRAWAAELLEECAHVA